jgi:hypothetical protein
MKVLVACEFSGVVRDSFRALGHDAYSCDLLNSAEPSKHHIIGDVLGILNNGWDLIIAHPPCTHLCSSGAQWWKYRPTMQTEAISFVDAIWRADCQRLALENPIGALSRLRKPTQIVQPWMFGHGETKATCLWLRGLTKLTPTNVVSGREQRVHRMSPSPDRWKLRSITYPGIAQAMAAQWGKTTLDG